MDLLIIRLGINYDEYNSKKASKRFKKLITDYKVAVIIGENDSLQTSFEIVKLS